MIKGTTRRIGDIIRKNYGAVIVVVFILLYILIALDAKITDAGGKIYFYDLFFPPLWIYVFWCFYRNKGGFHQEKTLVFLTAGFVLFYAFALAYHALTGGSAVNAGVLIRPVLWPAAVYLALSFNKGWIDHIIKAIMLMLTALGVIQIIWLLTFSQSPRQLPLLGNVIPNVIIQLMGILLWYLVWVYRRDSIGIGRRLLIYGGIFNALGAIFMAICSGTRILFILTAVLICIMIIVNRGNVIAKLKRIGLFILSSAILVLVILNFNIANSAINVYRSFSYVSEETINSLVVIDLGDGTNNKEKLDEYKENKEVTIELSDNMRNAIWKDSLDLISEDFLFGYGSLVVISEIPDSESPGGVRKFAQSPHNFVLEVTQGIGVIGLVIYILLMFFPLLFILSRRNSFKIKANMMLLYIVVFGVSLIQPIITTKILISLFFWVMLAAIPYLCEEGSYEAKKG